MIRKKIKRKFFNEKRIQKQKFIGLDKVSTGSFPLGFSSDTSSLFNAI